MRKSQIKEDWPSLRRKRRICWQLALTRTRNQTKRRKLVRRRRLSRFLCLEVCLMWFQSLKMIEILLMKCMYLFKKNLKAKFININYYWTLFLFTRKFFPLSSQSDRTLAPVPPCKSRLLLQVATNLEACRNFFTNSPPMIPFQIPLFHMYPYKSVHLSLRLEPLPHSARVLEMRQLFSWKWDFFCFSFFLKLIYFIRIFRYIERKFT